jgi:hypothetical protein
VGGAAGGIIGGIGGYLGSSDDSGKQFADHNRIKALISQGYGPAGIANYTAPQMTAAQAGPAAQMRAAQLQMGDDPFRRAQLAQLGQLQGIASGQQRGAGELAVQRQMANALAAQQANARMARGGNAALAYRNAANQSAAVGSTAAGLGQQAALTDQMNAQGMLGQIGAAGRQGDYSTANANAGYQQQAGLQNAGFQQQTGLANAGFQQGANQYNAGLQQQGQQLNSQNYLELLRQLQGMNATELTGQNAIAASNQQRNDALLGAGLNSAGAIIAAQQYGRSAPTTVQAAPSVGGTGGGELINPYAASDERLKTDVTDERDKIDAMLDGLRPVGWRYKDPKFGEGRHSGIMAQAMERSEAGKQVVVDTPDGKMLDVRKALGAALASSARLNERLRKLEGAER